MFIWNSCLAGSVHHSHRYNCIEASCVCVFLHHSHSRERISNVFIHCYLSFHWIHLSKPPYAQCALNYNTMMNIHTEEIRRMKKNLCNDFLSFHFLFFLPSLDCTRCFSIAWAKSQQFLLCIICFWLFCSVQTCVAYCILPSRESDGLFTKDEERKRKWKMEKKKTHRRLLFKKFHYLLNCVFCNSFIVQMVNMQLISKWFLY